MRAKYLLAMVAAVALIAGCGGSETTTVIQESDAPEPKTKTVTEKAPESKPAEPSEPSDSPPDVVGLTLPAAKSALKDAGYEPDISNTDATFGILVPENYTVCEQSEPVGDLVPILAEKEGC